MSEHPEDRTGDPMPVFTIKAKDRLALDAIEAYRRACLSFGLSDQAAEVGKAMREIEDWQKRNPNAVKYPDHKHVPVTDD